MSLRRGPSRAALFLTAALELGAACSRGGSRPADAGRDVPATFDTAMAGSGGGGTGGVVGAAGTGGGVSGGSSGGDPTDAGAAGITGSAGTFGSAGTGGSRGGTGGVATAGAGGTPAPLFPCIENWPQRPAGVQKVAPLPVEPQVLWTKALPVSGTGVASTMAVTGTGVALSIGYHLLIYDGDGNLVAQVTKPQPTGFISSPVAAPDGSVFFADASNAYRVDGAGRPIWEKPLGGNQTGQEFGAPRAPALDPAGRLYLSALDGNLWTFRGEDGQVLSSVGLGLLKGAPRYITLGFGNVLVIDRGGIAAAGPNVRADGLFATDTGTWMGEVTAGDGNDGLYVIGGYDIGLVVSRTNSTTDAREISTYDKCGNLRWRVPGSHAGPLAIGFNDDLIVLDSEATGGGQRRFALRRFSKDGTLLAGPVAVSDTFCGRSFVGADDTFYYVGGASDGYRLRAFDASLREIWTIPFPHCPDAALLAPGGKLFTARGLDGKLAAVQTTSPGPAAVSWAQVGRDARATRWLAP